MTKREKERCSPMTTRTANLPSLTGVCKQSCCTYCTRLLWDWPAVQQAAAAASWCLCVPQPCFPDLCLEQSFDIHPLMLEWKNTSLSQNIRRDFKTCKNTPDNHWTVDIQRDCLAAAQGSKSPVFLQIVNVTGKDSPHKYGIDIGHFPF